MHHVTRDVLLARADAEERRAELKSNEAQKLLTVAIDLDNEAAACLETAKALRADAAGGKSVGTLTLAIDTSEIRRVIEAATAQARAAAASLQRPYIYDPRARR